MFGCFHNYFKLDILLFFNFRQILAMISIFITISQMIWNDVATIMDCVELTWKSIRSDFVIAL